MPYYTYGSTANFLVLESTALVYKLYEKNSTVTRSNVMLEIFEIERVIR